MNRYRFLLLPGYLIGVSLIAIPLLDAVLSALPLRPGDVGWRFGFEGLLSRAIMTPLLGLFIVSIVAGLFEQRRVIRTVAVLAAVAAVSSVVLVVLFTLDALTLRRQVRPDAMRAFDVASVVATLKYLWGAIVLVFVALSSWRASKARPSRHGADVAFALQMGELSSQPAQSKTSQTPG